MIIRVSQVMASKLGVGVTRTEPVEANPLLDWAVHLFRCGRLQYVLVVNTTSLFPVVLTGRGLTNQKSFLQALWPPLQEQHRVHQLEAACTRWLEPALERNTQDSILWSKVGLRPVMGSMNELIHYAKHIADEAAWLGEGITPEQLTSELGKNILSVIAYHNPVDAHRQMIESLLR